MPIILAIEPDRRQAAHVSAIVRHRVGAELILADTTEAALDAIGSRVPDLVLVPALLSPQDDAALNAALRVIAAAAHVRALTIPVFANGVEHEPRVGGLLSRWIRGRSDAASDGCDPAVFAEQIKEYLREAAAERAAAVEDALDSPAVAAPPVVERHASIVDEPPAIVAEFVAAEPIVDEFTAAPPAVSGEPFASSSPDAYEYVVRPAADAFAVASQGEQVEAVAGGEVTEQAEAVQAVEPVAPYEPFVFEPSERTPSYTPSYTPPAYETPAYEAPAHAAPAYDYAARPIAEPYAAPEEPAYEFAFASEPEFVSEPARELVAADRDPAPADESGEESDEDAIVIDLSEDIEEISPEPAAEAVFDGEPMGIYLMPSLEDEGFRIDADFAAPLSDVDEAPVSKFRPDIIPGMAAEPLPRFAAHVPEPMSSAEPVLEEFLDESEIVEEFAAAAAATTAEVVDAAPAEPVYAESWPAGPDVPAPRLKREDGRVVTGLRTVPTWPTIEGVDVEPPVPLVSFEEFSETIAPSKPQPLAAAPAKAPVTAAPKPAPAPVAAPAKPAAAAAAAAAKSDHLEWAELVASLRQDIERRRNQPPAVAATPAPRQHTPAPHVAEMPRKRKATPVQDEWGFFDPEQCGFAALLAKLDEFSDGAEEKDVRQPS